MVTTRQRIALFLTERRRDLVKERDELSSAIVATSLQLSNLKDRFDALEAELLELGAELRKVE